MKALITGASSGIGRDIARVLAERGCELILVARREERLRQLADELPVPCEIIPLDLGTRENCVLLFERTKSSGVDILVNNAGFGLYGPFDEGDAQRELAMLDLNVAAMQLLMKLFLRHFEQRGGGYILNVASSAAFMPGPLLACYYATKAYVLRLTQAVYEELRRKKSPVYVGALCPGPVATEFDDVAGTSFSIRQMSSRRVAEIAVKGMFRGKTVIVPGFVMRAGTALSRFVPTKLLLRISYRIQKKKGK